MLRIKKKCPEVITPAAALLMTDDPPPQPPGRKLEEIPLFMRKPMPMDFLDNSHLSEPEDAVEEIFHGTPAEIALEFKVKGNEHFKAKQWWDAREAYLEGIEFWPEDPKLMEVLWLNVAAANIELGHWPGVLHGATEAITLNLKSSKGYYRAACALIHYKRSEEATDCCKRVISYDSENEAIKSLLDDPKLRGNGSAEIKTTGIRLALEKAYKHHSLVIVQDKSADPTPEVFPYFSPSLPNSPTKAPLYCNITLKYIERNALDILVGVKTDEPIGLLLERCLPGNAPPDGWKDLISFDPSLKSKKQVKKLKQQLVKKAQETGNKHPTWDPNSDYIPSNIVLYIETYTRQVVEVSPKRTLAQNFKSVTKPASGGVEGVCLEQGSIFINVFRRDSKVEKLWKEGKGRTSSVLTQPKYRKNGKEEMLASGQLRTIIVDAPQDHLIDLSIAARGEILKGPDIHIERAGTQPRVPS